MKKNNKLKLVLVILIIVLVSMISFGGIYVQKKNKMDNIVPEYVLGKDLKGFRRIELKVSEEIKETIKYDEQGNVITDDNLETHVSRVEEIKVNEPLSLTEENFQKSKQIIEKRLEAMYVTDYVIKQNRENGTIVLEIPENINTDRVVGQIYMQGKFEIVDNDTKEVLMTNDDIKKVESGYGATSTGETAIFINIEFNKEGKEKFRNITNTYVETTKETEENLNTNETGKEHVHEDGTVHEEEENKETTIKQIAINVEDTTLLTTYFNAEINNGILQLSVASSSSSTDQEMQEALEEANSMEALIGQGKMPLVYEIEQNKYIISNIEKDDIAMMVSAIIVFATLGMVYFVIKYKEKGILASLSLIGYVAVLLLALRLFNVEITIASIIGIFLSILLTYITLFSILKNKEILSVIRRYTLIYIPVVIISVTFTLLNITMGPVLFWGILINLLYNLGISNILLK